MSQVVVRLGAGLVATALAFGTCPVTTAAPDGNFADRVAWAHKYGLYANTMGNLPKVAKATPQALAAAEDLLVRTVAATAPYNDRATAEAAGYDLQASLAREQRKSPELAQMMAQEDAGQMLKNPPMLHVTSSAAYHDGKVLDPSAPESLMYEYHGHGHWELIGVMFVANESYPAAPPNPASPITRWHYHDKPADMLMMHIYFAPGNDLTKAYAGMPV